MGQQDLDDLVVIFRGGQVQGSEAVMDPLVQGGALVLQQGPQGAQHALARSIMVRHVRVLVLRLGVSSSGQKRSHNVLQLPHLVIVLNWHVGGSVLA